MHNTNLKSARDQAVTREADRTTVRQHPAPLVGTVAVERRYPRGHQAVCSCGQLSSRRRLLYGFAVGDAYEHAAQTDCVPAQPLSRPRIAVA
ncbi:hypothetical protein GCM10009856_07500 [Mycolicibacterium llatzerense]